ncbi:restriction endonuclease subunit S [Pediococcus pentosaceus]
MENEDKNRVPKLRYPGYTDPWVLRKLGEVTELNPKNIIPDTFEYVDLESVSGTQLKDHRTLSKNEAPSRAQRVAKINDIFYQTVRPYQKNNFLFNLPKANYVFSTGYAQLRPLVNSLFLFTVIQLTSFVNEVLNMSTGTSYPAINGNDLMKIKFYTTENIKEQQAIGSLFKKIDDLIALQQRKIEHLRKRKAGLLQKMFPKDGADVPEVRFPEYTDAWVLRKFNDMFLSIGDGIHGTPIYDEKGSTFFINGNNLSDGKIIISNEIKKVNSKQKSKVDNSLTSDTILMSINGTIGSLARYNGEDIMLGKSVSYMIPKYIDSNFAYFELETSRAKNYFKNSLTGTTIKNLGLKSIRERFFNIPIMREQKSIGSLFKKLDELITLQQRKLEHLELQKRGLLQQMFV